MRVIGGVAKGRRLLSVPGATTRPITDRVKESLFNILGGRVVDARFLDLFAGTGSVGIEALSRGAAEAVFVEWNRKALRVLRRNLELTGLADRARVVAEDVFRFIARAEEQSFDSAQDRPFDLIYIAPPQYKGLWAKTLLALDTTSLPAPESIVVIQIHPKEYQAQSLARLELVDQRKYGSTLLCFYSPR